MVAMNYFQMTAVCARDDDLQGFEATQWRASGRVSAVKSLLGILLTQFVGVLSDGEDSGVEFWGWGMWMQFQTVKGDLECNLERQKVGLMGVNMIRDRFDSNFNEPRKMRNFLNSSKTVKDVVWFEVSFEASLLD